MGNGGGGGRDRDQAWLEYCGGRGKSVSNVQKKLGLGKQASFSQEYEGAMHKPTVTSHSSMLCPQEARAQKSYYWRRV